MFTLFSVVSMHVVMWPFIFGVKLHLVFIHIEIFYTELWVSLLFVCRSLMFLALQFQITRNRSLLMILEGMKCLQERAFPYGWHVLGTYCSPSFLSL